MHALPAIDSHYVYHIYHEHTKPVGMMANEQMTETGPVRLCSSKHAHKQPKYKFKGLYVGGKRGIRNNSCLSRVAIPYEYSEYKDHGCLLQLHNLKDAIKGCSLLDLFWSAWDDDLWIRGIDIHRGEDKPEITKE